MSLEGVKSSSTHPSRESRLSHVVTAPRGASLTVRGARPERDEPGNREFGVRRDLREMSGEAVKSGPRP